MTIIPANTVIGIFRTFDAASPYSIYGTAITALGGLKQHVENGRFGRDVEYLHWTTVIELPLGTDIRDGYNSQDNSWTSANADTVLIQDYPIPGWCTAFLVVTVQRINRGLPNDRLRVYMDRCQPEYGNCPTSGPPLPPPSGGTIATGCCPANLLPTTLNVTFTGACPCLNGVTVPVVYDPTLGGGIQWYGSIVTTCALPLQPPPGNLTLGVLVACNIVAGNPTWQIMLSCVENIDVSFAFTIYAGNSSVEIQTAASVVCSPLALTFNCSGDTCCNSIPGITAVVTT